MVIEPQWLALGIFGGSIVLSIGMVYYRRYQRSRASARLRARQRRLARRSRR